MRHDTRPRRHNSGSDRWTLFRGSRVAWRHGVSLLVTEGMSPAMGCTGKGVRYSHGGVPILGVCPGALRPERVSRHPVMNRPPSTCSGGCRRSGVKDRVCHESKLLLTSSRIYPGVADDANAPIFSLTSACAHSRHLTSPRSAGCGRSRSVAGHSTMNADPRQCGHCPVIRIRVRRFGTRMTGSMFWSADVDG